MQSKHSYISSRIKKIKKLIAHAYDPYDVTATIKDAITDLRHWADKAGVDFNAAVESSYNHYIAEKNGRD